jgi:multiple sugar transport system ATP-binding protein
MAMVFQSYAIYPHMSVRENLAFPLKLAKLARADIAERVARAAAMLELNDLLDRNPASLSGGQRQRVAMGRALVREPVAFLLDEPLSNLDARLRVQMRTELARLQRDLRTTTIYVTHDQTEALTLGHRVAVMRRGVIQQIGTPRELYAEPRNVFVAGFIGSPAMNFLPGEIGAGRLILPLGEIALTAPQRESLPTGDRAVIAGVRPEDFRLAASVETANETGLAFETNVDFLEWLGADLYVHFNVKAAGKGLRALPEELEREVGGADRITVVARADPAARVAENERITLWLDARRLHLFDAETGERIVSKK